MDISFDFKGDPIGGKLVNYLLEKSRVVYQQSGERNFHSFYYLVLGAPESELSEFSLRSSDMDQYGYINQGGKNVNAQMNDKQNYRLVNDAMRISNFEPELVKTIWSIVAAIIHLGNVKFESNETTSDLNNNRNGVDSASSQTKICPESMREIKIISKLLKLDEAELVKSLTSRLIASGAKEILTTYHSVKEAAYARDALSKVNSVSNNFHLSKLLF